MPVINPQRDPLRLGSVQAEAAPAVQTGQITSDVSPDAAISANSRAQSGQAMANFVSTVATEMVEKENNRVAAKARGDYLKGSMDVESANSTWTGDVYRTAFSQSAMSSRIADYMSTRESSIQSRLANGMSYDAAMAADRQDLEKLLDETGKYQNLVGPEFTKAAQGQLGQLMTQQNKDAAVHAAGVSIAKANQGIQDLVFASAATSAASLQTNDTGGFTAQRDALFRSIDNAEFLSPEQKATQKQSYFVAMGHAATSGRQLNVIMQQAQEALGVNADAALNRLESQRQKVTLGERIDLLNELNTDYSQLAPEDQLLQSQKNAMRVQQMVKEGTLSPEQGESYMKQQNVQLSKAQASAMFSNFMTNGGDLGKVAAAQGKSVQTVYDNMMAGASTQQKLAFAQVSQAHRDSAGFAVAMKDAAKSIGNELQLLQSTPVGDLSKDQLTTLQTLDQMKQQNPAMFDTLLDGMGDDGAMLRSLSESGGINSSTLQAYQEKRRQAQALAGKDIGKKARDELILDAANSVNGRTAANGSWLAGSFNRADWNTGALSEVSGEILSGMSNQEIALGGKTLIAQRMADRTMQVLLDDGGVRSSKVGTVTSERGVSIERTVQGLGLANKEDLANLIAEQYKSFNSTYSDNDGQVLAPKLMRDGSLQFTVMNNSTGQSYSASLSAQQMQQQAAAMMESRAKGNEEYLKNQANVRPVVVGGQTVLMRGTDFSVGDTQIKGNWVASAAQELADQEGFNDSVYSDTRGVKTWGIGMTDSSGVQPHEVATPQQAADKLQGLIQTNYGKSAVQALNKANVPVDKSTFVLMTEIAYQSPQSAQQMATALGKYYTGKATAADVQGVLGGTAAFKAGAERRQTMRANRLQHVLEQLDQARRANRTSPNQPG